MKAEDKQEVARQLENSIADLTSYLTIEPEPVDSDDIRWRIKVESLALAALTAQPVAWLVEFHEPMTDDYCREVKTLQLEKPTGHYMACATPLIRAADYEVQE